MAHGDKAMMDFFMNVGMGLMIILAIMTIVAGLVLLAYLLKGFFVVILILAIAYVIGVTHREG